MKTKEVIKIKGYKGLKKLIPFYKKYTGLMIFTICFLLFSAIIAFLALYLVQIVLRALVLKITTTH